MEKADVVIVGGGIAGLGAAATLCTESDLDVLMVEARRVGAIGKSPLVFPELMHEFGLEQSILRYYTEFVFCSPLGAQARFAYGKKALACLDYAKACELLCHRAARNGLRFRSARAVEWVPRKPRADRPVTVHLDDGGCVETRLLIDASGEEQWAARQLGLRRSPYVSVCYGEVIEGSSCGEESTAWFLAPNKRYGTGGGWFYPIGPGVASMGYAVVAAAGERKEDIVASGYRAARQEYQPFANWVKGGVTRRVEAGTIPVGRIGRFAADRILIVGDAAGQATTWVMMGVNTGLLNGRACAHTALRAFSKTAFDHRTLSMYEKTWANEHGESFWRALTLIQPLFYRQSDEEWDRYIASCQRMSPDQHLRHLRDNPATALQRAYAVAGYLRRKTINWLKRVWMTWIQGSLKRGLR